FTFCATFSCGWGKKKWLKSGSTCSQRIVSSDCVETHSDVPTTSRRPLRRLFWQRPAVSNRIMPVITLPDGSQRTYSEPVTLAKVAADIGPGLAKAAVAGKVNGKLVDHFSRDRGLCEPRTDVRSHFRQSDLLPVSAAQK